MSDITVDPASVRQVRYEELQKFREQVKESEDQWQDVSIACTATQTHTHSSSADILRVQGL